MSDTPSKIVVDSQEPRFVAYIDVLGFRGELKSGHRIRAYFRAIQAARKAAPGEVEYKVLGDAIVLSTPIGDGEMLLKWLRILLGTVAEIQRQLALSDFWTRGAIACGPMYYYEDEANHEDKYYTGPALARAYELETQVAKYPRVIVDPSIIDLREMKDAKIETIGDLIEAINQSADSRNDPTLPRERLLYDWNRPKGEEFLSLQTWGRISDILEKDVPLFVDYFSPMFAEEKRQDLRSIIGILETRSKSSIEHYEKYRWVAKYLLATVYRRVEKEENLASSESAMRLNKI